MISSPSPTTYEPGASLSDAYRSVPVTGVGWLKRLMAFMGPGYLVSVGYMDPGNWATDLGGGSRFGYALLWVILVSSFMAVVLQTLCARMGIVLGRDLAQACRDYYKKPASIALWLLCEVAIVACDVAEVIGSAIALNLLFGLNMVWGVLLTGLDVIALLGLMRYGFRKIEAVVLTLVGTIFVSFAVNVFLAKPDWGAVAVGLVKPSLPGPGALAIAVGILGATVMPHNLYLHSSMVQTRAFDMGIEGKREAVKLATIDTVLSLGVAFFVNAGILILAAAVFYRAGVKVDDLRDAHKMLSPALGGGAATLFAVALLASGQSSTITATLAGQIVMEGFLHMKIAPWIRRMVTRALAIVPAVILVGGSGGHDTVRLLTDTQIVLSMQLPFAVFPLVMLTSTRSRMGEFVNPWWMKVVAFAICIAITLLNLDLLLQSYGIVWLVVAIAVVVAFGLYVTLGRGGSRSSTTLVMANGAE